AQDTMRAYEAGTVRALCLVNTTSDLRDHLREGRAVCEQTLNLFGVLDQPDWQDQDRWRRLAPEDQRRLAEDSRELLLLLARARAGRQDKAIAHLNEALRLNPRHYWSCMQRGLCYQERGEAALAAGDFGACVGLWPDFAWGYFNRACARALGGKKTEAIEDYT